MSAHPSNAHRDDLQCLSPNACTPRRHVYSTHHTVCPFDPRLHLLRQVAQQAKLLEAQGAQEGGGKGKRQVYGTHLAMQRGEVLLAVDSLQTHSVASLNM